MSGRIPSIVPTQRRAAPEPLALGLPQDLPARLHFWRGASGKRYVHSVYSLIECPPLPKAMYLLVHRSKDGQRQVLHIGCGRRDASTLNMARIRQRGAASLPATCAPASSASSAPSRRPRHTTDASPRRPRSPSEPAPTHTLGM